MQTKGDNNSKLEGRKIEFRLEEPIRSENCFGTENSVLVVLP
jgi:hypothetical protein